MDEKPDLKKSRIEPGWSQISMKHFSPERIICSHCALGGYHLLGMAPSKCVGFPHGTEMYLPRRDSTNGERSPHLLIWDWREQPRQRLLTGSAVSLLTSSSAVSSGSLLIWNQPVLACHIPSLHPTCFTGSLEGKPSWWNMLLQSTC